MKEPQTILLAEFYTSTAYLNRLLFVFFEIENLHKTAEGKNKLEEIYHNLKKYFDTEKSNIENTFNLSTFQQDLNNVNSLIEYSIKNPFYIPKNIERHILFLNLIYKSAHKLHLILKNSTESDVALPQSLMGQINELEPNEVPLIIITNNDTDFSLTTPEKENHVVEFINSKRLEKYQNYIGKGHKGLAINNFAEAIRSFQKALILNETAEILNLIGWSYSLTGDLSKAKEFSYKAIEKDSQYGPALNDYGNYLFMEGKIKESLKWFELAKRSLNYENREFAFINAGKAYMQIDMYNEAMNEFSLALCFTPYNEELQQAILKIKNNLEQENTFDRLS